MRYKPKAAHTFWVYGTDFEKWIVSNTKFDDEELIKVPRKVFNEDELNLINENKQDREIISLIRGMSDEQLDYFMDFTFTKKGQRKLMESHLHWVEDSLNFENLGDLDYVRRELNERNGRDIAESRAYFVIANRNEGDYFFRGDKRRAA